MFKVVLSLLAAAALVGCAGKYEYVRPVPPAPSQSSKVIDKPREVVWNRAVPELGKQFFVINNLDKSSGLINVSYSGDPEKYIDCGSISSYVKNARGERTYNFPGSRANVSYEVMTTNLFFNTRKMELDGRVNLIFEELSPTQTRVTANTRYVVKRDRTVRDVEGRTQSSSDSVSFNSNNSGSFAPGPDGGVFTCYPNGALEREILNSVE